MRDDRGIGAEPLRGAAAHKDIVILVGRVALRLSNAGEHEPFGAPLARIAARPAREAKPVRDAEGFELLEAAPCDLVRHEEERRVLGHVVQGEGRSEEHTSELQSLMRISYAVFCLKKK